MKKLKDSGVEWIGQIPAEWKRVKLKEVTNIIMGQSPEAQDIKDFGNIPFMQGNREFGSIYPNAVKFCDNSPKKSRIGDILLSVRAPVGAINVSDKVYAIGRGLCSICATSINSKFLMYFLMLIMQDTKKFGQGSTFDAITIQELKQLPVLLPPINTQNRIASYLDRKCAQIDAIIAKQQQIIEKLKEYKLSVITEAVTKGLDPNVPMKDSGVEWIEEIPEKWQKTKLKNTCQFINGDRSSNYPSPNDYVDKGIPFLGADSLCGRYVDIAQSKKITNEKYRSMGGAKIQKGDILYTLRGSTIGKNAMAMFDDGTVASSLMVIRPISLVPEFLLYWLNSEEEFQQRQSYINGSTAPNLSADNVGTFILFLPSTVEQLRIANFLDKKCNEIELAIQKKQRMIEKLSDYKKSLIYEVVTGKKEV